MFKVRETRETTHIIERSFPGALYEVRIRSNHGFNLLAKCCFDNGREAHSAFKLSAKTFIERNG